MQEQLPEGTCACGHSSNEHALVEESKVGACYAWQEHGLCPCYQYTEVND